VNPFPVNERIVAGEWICKNLDFNGKFLITGKRFREQLRLLQVDATY